MDRYVGYYKSPIGMIKITSSKDAVLELSFVKKTKTHRGPLPKILRDCLQQLDEYFLGQRTKFDLAINLDGTDFQQRVWQALKKIPFAQTLSYEAIAIKIKNPKACRAVGMANNKNKIAIIIPCHRVIGKSGALTGYAGGLLRKSWLLKHEAGQL